MKGACHCGKVGIKLKNPPEYINFCDCSLCLKLGGAWGYFSSADVSVDGVTSAYRRVDYDAPAVEIRFCTKCGTTTHWTLTEHHPGNRMGVNMRIFEPAMLAGIEARTLDGRNWFGEGEAEHRRAIGKLGQDVFL
ncbi:GFA family protein [Erythrobacter sp. W53]|uniref:GFA family protein n=1 Tax=Erythrobacter sp. W53 TaxID=3425947 RepID=UPI003D7686BF